MLKRINALKLQDLIVIAITLNITGYLINPYVRAGMDYLFNK